MLILPQLLTCSRQMTYGFMSLETSENGWLKRRNTIGQKRKIYTIGLHCNHIYHIYLAILCDLFGMVKWHFERWSDLQLRDQKVTLNHLVCIVYIYIYIYTFIYHENAMPECTWVCKVCNGFVPCFRLFSNSFESCMFWSRWRPLRFHRTHMHLRVRTQVAEGGTMVAQPQSIEIKTLRCQIVTKSLYIK